jgi:hypothetical protein
MVAFYAVPMARTAQTHRALKKSLSVQPSVAAELLLQ